MHDRGGSLIWLTLIWLALIWLTLIWLPNLTFLTSETQKFQFDKFLPCALSPTQSEPKEPKRSQINPHLDHETAVHILLEDAAYRCFDLAHTDLAHLSPNRATHLKSPKNLGWGGGGWGGGEVRGVSGIYQEFSRTFLPSI